MSSNSVVDAHRYDADLSRSSFVPLSSAGDYSKAASLCSKVLGQDKKAWEDWIFLFAQRKQLQVSIEHRSRVPSGLRWSRSTADSRLSPFQAIIPFTPTKDPQLSDLVYEMILAHFLSSDRPVRLLFHDPRALGRVANRPAFPSPPGSPSDHQGVAA